MLVSRLQLRFFQLEQGVLLAEIPEKLQILVAGLEEGRLKEFLKVFLLFWLKGFQQDKQLHFPFFSNVTMASVGL